MNVLGTALSALLGQSRNIATSANNIANLATDGFKASRVSFSSGSGQAGGVRTDITRDIDRPGFVRQTSSNLDLSISGDGFFAVERSDGGLGFTREGAFSPNANGDLTNAAGSRLLGFPLDDAGNAIGGFDPAALAPVNIDRGNIAAQSTSEIDFQGNLNAASDPADPLVDFQRNVTIFDSTGASQTLSLEFQASGTNQFDLTVRDENGVALGGETLEFDSGGQLISPANGRIELNGIDFGNGSAPQDLIIDLNGTTQFSDEFSVRRINQDGFGPDNLTRVEIGEDGVVSGRFGNGASVDFAQIPLASFADPNALQPVSSTSFVATENSGDVNLTLPGQGGSGRIQPQSLEGSNVSLVDETINILQSEIAFRAALSVIRAEDENIDNLIDILS